MLNKNIKMFRLLSHQKNKNAFTLIEVLTAIFVILVGVVGTLAIIQQTIAFTALSSSRLVASYLAQEGIEIVRNIRDTNWLEGEDWLAGLSPGNWEADYLTQALTDSYDGDFLNIDANDFYSYSAGSPTKFKRKITIVQDTDTGAGCPLGCPRLKVSVLVEWQQVGKINQVTAQEYLYNWR